MSEREIRRRSMVRSVCKQAWIYLKRTTVSDLSWAFRIAWMKIRIGGLRVHHSKVRGVTYGNRQKLLKRLSCYRDEEIKLIVSREYDNPYDRNAIEIYASVERKGTACIGYVGKQLAESLSAMMDDGAWVIPVLETVTGGTRGKAFGMNFSFVIVT